MVHFVVKKKKGRPYLYVREVARVDGKPKVVSQIYIGSPDRVAAMARGETQEDIKLRVEEYGALWLAQQMDREIDLVGIVDSIIPPGAREKGPTIGEYFLYCVWNRMIEAVSKRKLAEWYSRTAIQHIRPVDLEELTSPRYWEKWDRVSEQALEEISRRFFSRIWEVEQPTADCLLFDTTNYYTYMGAQTDSDLAVRGKNKAGKHNLRQVGLGLLVARESRLPIYYKTYPGNLHDSRHFSEVMEEMFSIVGGLNKTKERLTVVIDKGMNSEDNFAWLDDHARMHFVTTYSTYYAEDLAAIPLEQFEPVDTEKNRRLMDDGHPEERLLVYRTRGEFWGKERAVVVTFNPASARKQAYTLDRKLNEIRQELLLMRAKVRDDQPQWRDSDTIWERYYRLCERFHVSSDLYDLEFEKDGSGLMMSFRKNTYWVDRHRARMGKSVIVTDNTDWTTAQIVNANLDRWQVEDRFRQSKNDDRVGVQPMRHWTDSKLRCHFFSCVVALTYLRRLELKLGKAGIQRTADDVMDDMQHLHSVLTMSALARKPRRRIETPTKTQAEVLSAFGCTINRSGVLQGTIP